MGLFGKKETLSPESSDSRKPKGKFRFEFSDNQNFMEKDVKNANQLITLLEDENYRLNQEGGKASVTITKVDNKKNQVFYRKHFNLPLEEKFNFDRACEGFFTKHFIPYEEISTKEKMEPSLEDEEQQAADLQINEEMSEPVDSLQEKETEDLPEAKTSTEPSLVVCTACRQLIPAEDKFCPKCGQIQQSAQEEETLESPENVQDWYVNAEEVETAEEEIRPESFLENDLADGATAETYSDHVMPEESTDFESSLPVENAPVQENVQGTKLDFLSPEIGEISPSAYLTRSEIEKQVSLEYEEQKKAELSQADTEVSKARKEEISRIKAEYNRLEEKTIDEFNLQLSEKKNEINDKYNRKIHETAHERLKTQIDSLDESFKNFRSKFLERIQN